MKYIPLAAVALFLAVGGFLIWQQPDVPVVTTGGSMSGEASNIADNVQTVVISASGAYKLTLPKDWRTEGIAPKDGLPYKDILVYDEKGALAMKITQPVREIGYEMSRTAARSKFGTGIGLMERVVRLNRDDERQGFVHYLWGVEEHFEDFFGKSFEVMVFFGDGKYSKTQSEHQAGIGAPYKFRSLEEINSGSMFPSQIEDIIGGISPREQ